MPLSACSLAGIRTDSHSGRTSIYTGDAAESLVKIPVFSVKQRPQSEIRLCDNRVCFCASGKSLDANVSGRHNQSVEESPTVIPREDVAGG
jgi:hypothetical protein